MLVASFTKELNNGTYKANVVEDNSILRIDYYDNTGARLNSDEFSGKSLQEVTAIAHNWVNSIQMLNG